MLHADYTPGAGPPIVFLHGFMGQCADWAPIAARTAEVTGRPILTFDLPGHGQSSLGDQGDWTAFADALVAGVLAHTSQARFDLVGYSMGGRLALVTRKLRPEAVRALLVIGAHPGLQTATERAARTVHDAELAAQLFADATAFLDDWETNALFGPATSEAWSTARARRRADAAGASFAWSEALRGFTLGGQPDAWEPVPDEGPTTFIAGADDPRYCAIGKQFAALAPLRSFHAIPSAAHAAHLDRPDAVLAHLRRSLFAR